MEKEEQIEYISLHRIYCDCERCAGFRKAKMAEKVKTLKLERDYKKNLYFIDRSGNVCCKPKNGEGETLILHANAIERDDNYLYFIDADGDVARALRAKRRSA